MAKNKYTISTLFSADNRNFISALEKNRSSLEKFKGDTKATEKKLSTLWNATHKASKGFDSMRSSVKASTIAMGALMASGIKSAARGLVSMAKTSIMAASDAQEMQSKFNTVFGDMRKDAEAFAKSFVSEVGGSVLTVKKQMANTQDLLTGFGASKDAAFGLSKQIQTLGTDLAAFNNMSEDEAVDRLRKGLLGEHENLKALGIIINENALKQELSSRGDKRKLNTLTELEKIELRYAIATKQSTNAIGSAKSEAGGFARQMETLKGNLENLAVTFGSRLLPPLTEFISYVNSNFDGIMDTIKEKINQVRETFNNWLPVIAGVTTAFVAFKAIIIAGETIQGIMTFVTMIKTLREMQLLSAFAQGILNTTMLASPLTWIALAVAAVIAIFVNWEKVINTVITACKKLWNAIAGFVGLDSLKFKIDADIPDGTSQTTSAPPSNVPKYATGTPYHTGGVALVGEHGPEIVNLPSGSGVTPSDKTAQVFRNNQATNNITINVNGSGMNGEEIAREIMRVLRPALANA